MHVLAENPVLSDPDVNHVGEALQNLEFLVVQDFFPTRVAALALRLRRRSGDQVPAARPVQPGIGYLHASRLLRTGGEAKWAVPIHNQHQGEIGVKAKVTPTMPSGVVFIPFHFAENAANVLTHRALDPVAKIPEHKVCALTVAGC